jgi:hypothetical protein
VELIDVSTEPPTTCVRDTPGIEPYATDNVTECDVLEATMAASLVHGLRYRCDVIAYNYAGLSSRASSVDFVVDVSGAVEIGLDSVYVSDPVTGQPAVFVGYLEDIHVTFTSDLRVVDQGNETTVVMCNATDDSNVTDCGVFGSGHQQLSPVERFTFMLELVPGASHHPPTYSPISN